MRNASSARLIKNTKRKPIKNTRMTPKNARKGTGEKGQILIFECGGRDEYQREGNGDGDGDGDGGEEAVGTRGRPVWESPE